MNDYIDANWADVLLELSEDLGQCNERTFVAEVARYGISANSKEFEDLVLVFFQHKSFDFRWLKQTVGGLDRPRLTEILRAIYVDMCELKVETEWQQFAQFGIDPVELQLRLAGENASLGETIECVQLLRRIGSGSTVTVFLGWHQRLGMEVAVRVPTMEASTSIELMKRIRSDLVLRSSHQVEGIPKSIESFECSFGVVVVCEFVIGEPLHKSEFAASSISQCLEVMKQASKIVDSLHLQGLLLEDAKPENFLIDTAGRIHLVDLNSIRREEDHRELTYGTTGYLSPEQVGRSRETVGVKSDVYALGSMLDFLLNRCMQQCISVAEASGLLSRGISLTIPAQVRKIVEISKSFEQLSRFETAADFSNACQAVLEGRSPELDSSRRQAIIKWRAGIQYFQMLLKIEKTIQFAQKSYKQIKAEEVYNLYDELCDDLRSLLHMVSKLPRLDQLCKQIELKVLRPLKPLDFDPEVVGPKYVLRRLRDKLVEMHETAIELGAVLRTSGDVHVANHAFRFAEVVLRSIGKPEHHGSWQREKRELLSLGWPMSVFEQIEPLFLETMSAVRLNNKLKRVSLEVTRYLRWGDHV